MSELFHQLGIDWKLLISQAVNFGLLILALRFFAYQPMLKLLRERKQKIEEGLRKAEEADTRLADANLLAKTRMKAAEEEAMLMLKDTEHKAKDLEDRLVMKAQEKEAGMMREAEERAKAREAEVEAVFAKEAQQMVKAALVKTVELSPDAVDEALIKKAVGAMKRD
jgi:F-type H+-transporting ATPase subunit b